MKKISMNVLELPDIDLNKELKKCKRDNYANKNYRNGYCHCLAKQNSK